jgi:hypothetical protein
MVKIFGKKKKQQIFDFFFLAYFRLKALFLVPNISQTTLNALESPTTQTYQNLSLLFRQLVRNETNSSFDFLPLVYTMYVYQNSII